MNLSAQRRRAARAAPVHARVRQRPLDGRTSGRSPTSTWRPRSPKRAGARSHHGVASHSVAPTDVPGAPCCPAPRGCFTIGRQPLYQPLRHILGL